MVSGNAVYLVRYAVYLINKDKKEVKNLNNILDKIISFVFNNAKLVILFIVGGVFYKFYNRGKKHLKKFSTVGSTITDEGAQNIASSLFSAMADLGTDEDLIYSSLKGLSKADFAKVYNAFGFKPYLPHLGMEDEYFGTDYDLVSWLTFELSASELEKLKSELPFIFS